MSEQTGFNYEVMISRLHGGLCAFQSLRAHRRHREQMAESPCVTAEPSRPTRVDAPGPPAPQAFVNLSDRAVPTIVDSGLFGVVPPPAPSPTPAPTPAAPAPPAEPPPPQSATAPMSTVSTLKLPPPTPPQRLGLIYGGHAPEPAPTPATTTTTSPPPTLESPAPRPQDAAHAQETPSLASITALLDTRARAEAQRLDQANTDHRTALATLLREHRDELRAQAEAEATRTTQRLREHQDELRAQREADAVRTAQLLREVLADHRAEQARAAQTHADHLAQILAAQQSNTDPHATAGELRAALLEQATLQREAHEDVADQISALTTIVADLGQTVGMLAVAAAHKGRPSNLPTRPIFTPPPTIPRVDPVASAALPQVEPVAVTAAPSVDPARIGPAPESSAPPPAAANHKAESSQARSVCPNASLSSRITDEPARLQPFRLKLAREAADRARMDAALEDDSDDDLATAPNDDDPLHPRPLAPCTAIEPHNDRARNV